ncbi:MAG TPA: hypothetical protein ENH82_06145 [bacterium]|nr:hypothetical protein [bacterium]
MAESKLRPCPFCGGDGELQESGIPQFWYVVCLSCFIHGPIVFKKKAIEAWNRGTDKKEAIYRKLLELIADPKIDNVRSDLKLDIKDWLGEWDRIFAGEEPMEVIGCESCPPVNCRYWTCQLCAIWRAE